MKRFLLSVALISLLMAPRNTYQKMTVITELDYREDVVTAEDDAGHLWQFTECEDWMINDLCELTFIDTGIPFYPYDDTIVRTIYKGYTK